MFREDRLETKAYLLFYTLRNAPGTMTSMKRNTGNVDKDRMDELTREFEAKKRKLDEEEIEKEKNEKKITLMKRKKIAIRVASSEEEKQEEQEDAVTVISARKNGEAKRWAFSREELSRSCKNQNSSSKTGMDQSHRISASSNKENAVNEQRVVTRRTQSKKKKTKVTKKTGKRK